MNPILTQLDGVATPVLAFVTAALGSTWGQIIIAFVGIAVLFGLIVVFKRAFSGSKN